MYLLIRRQVSDFHFKGFHSLYIHGDPYKNRSIMNQEAAETARESLELVFRMSNILETGLDRHTLSVLIALCDIGLNPEALATLVKELRRDSATTTTTVD
ncbi:GIP2 [Arabidopsis thaliana]|nr:GIP2 [Arabidopsis thaliana]